MCTQVQFNGILYSTPRQLAARLGADWLLEGSDRHGEMEWCLCVIDVPRTLERSAPKWTRKGRSEMFVVAQ
ncbi:MAG: hypothetical protein EOQ54_02460 [Mesorhizobium sp.]|uniref:hypothetical protein n=1 Tax=Mesorhizobium sp. TaxID=1871066 RepID=UPI000FE8CA3C|nr:hypothetical protein [Mesorhizobium sp.]RWG07772.1 MAG: hypothetical protein EOQ54_02460 [Mesorhizobium sp.]RWH02916.1 MAG: hypothetical protein EOQ72_03830 [Mesorhizobium sp.]